MELIIQVQKTDESIIQQVEQQAKQQNIALNEFLLHLIRTGLQMLQPIYHDLDNLAGTWSNEDERIFEHVVSDFGQIDESLWI